MTDDAHSEPRTPRPRYRRRRAPLGEHVAAVVAGLQHRYRDGVPEAIAVLARLRRAVNEEPGSAGVQEACHLPDEVLQREYLPDDEPSPSERALHTAVTLWALHQQSRRDKPMHTGNATFAEAIRRLAAASPNEETVYRRFTALGTAATYSELAFHARGIVKQLRDAQIGFDYGLLADDLRTFQHGLTAATGLTGPERVRALWGREYWRIETSPTAPSGTSTPPSEQV